MRGEKAEGQRGEKPAERRLRPGVKGEEGKEERSRSFWTLLQASA